MTVLNKANSLPALNAINRFLASPYYCILVMALSAIANILSLELPAYCLFALTAVYVCLLGEDLLPLIPLMLACYITPSAINNPGRNPASVFSGVSGWVIVALAAVMVLALFYRIIRQRKVFFSRGGKLLPGLLVLAGTYLLSGIGSKAYPQHLANNLLFAGIQAASLVLPYWLLSRGVKWENARRDYFAWLCFSAGGVLVCQVLQLYLAGNVVVDGIIQRERIYSGWGMYNNIGFLLGMMIPSAFYLATKYRRGWIGTVAGSVFLLCVYLTCSRSSILGSSFIYCLCVLIMLLYARNRKHNTIALVAVALAVIAIVALFHNQLLRLFSDLLRRGMDPNSRDTIYWEGLKLFAQNPLFGNSFFSPGYTPWDFSTLEGFSAFFPPRWHNTLVQLLASCGILGMGGYLFHRVQTVKLFFTKRHKEQVFIGCSLLVLIFCSLFDCHFFNIGPTMFYSAALAFAEHCTQKKDAVSNK